MLIKQSLVADLDEHIAKLADEHHAKLKKFPKTIKPEKHMATAGMNSSRRKGSTRRRWSR